MSDSELTELRQDIRSLHDKIDKQAKDYHDSSKANMLIVINQLTGINEQHKKLCTQTARHDERLSIVESNQKTTNKRTWAVLFAIITCGLSIVLPAILKIIKI